MKNILILTPFYPPNIGGAESYCESLVNEAAKDNLVTVLCFQPFNKQASIFELKSWGRIAIRRINWIIKHSHAWHGTSLRNFLSVFPQMLVNAMGLFSNNKFDIIHAQGLIAGLVGVFLKKRYKKKLFITLLALYNFKNKGRLFKALSRFVLTNCDIVFVEGENGQRDLRGLGHGINVKQFHHWCDQEIFKPPQVRPNGKIRMLFIGRPIPEKGKHIIEEAEKLINNPDKYEFIYVENVSYRELPKIYQNAHIVVIPSLYDEGYSRCVIEAASCGCIVIASNRGSLPEMLRGWAWNINPTGMDFKFTLERFGAMIDLNHHCNASHEHAKENFSSKNAEVFLESYR